MLHSHKVFWIMAALLMAPTSHANQTNNTTIAPSQLPTAGYIGIGIGKLPEPLRAHMPDGIAKTQGLFVAWFADISPAADDGIKLYDVLLSYDDKPIETPETFIETVRQDKPGRIANIKLVRQGQMLTLPITLGEQIKVERPKIAQTPFNQRPPQFYSRMPAGYPYAARPLPNPWPNPPQRTPYPGYQPYPDRGLPPFPMLPPPGTYPAPIDPRIAAQQIQPIQQAAPLNITGKPAYPMRKKPKKEAWGDKRNIWSDFYTDFTGDFWDSMINAPYDIGRMPGGWRAPTWSSPDPVTVGDAVLNQVPPIMEEAGNMTNFTD